MLIVMNPTYTLRVIIRDRMQNQQVSGGNLTGAQGAPVPWRPHKYFGGVGGTSGCDAALEAIRTALQKAGIDAEVSLDRFEHTGG